MIGNTDFITAQAYAVFVSGMSCHAEVSNAVTSAAIQHALLSFGGPKGCAAAAARAYGEHPDTASQRMRWARSVVTALYGSAAYPASVLHGAKEPRPYEVGSMSLVAHQY